MSSSRSLGLLVAALAATAVLGAAGGAHGAAPTSADRAERPRTDPAARPPTPAHGRFSGRVAIPGGRKLFLQCRGRGSPTVVLEAGSGDLGRIWSEPPVGQGRAVFPAVARFTRVCAYDRPGTYRLPGTFSRSDPVAMPRTARDIVLDLRALLRAADVPRPYVLAGHSFGGMIARLYATTYPRRVDGLVSIDAQNEDFVAAYKALLTPELYAAFVLDPQPPSDLEDYPDVELLDLAPSAAQMRQAQADTGLRRMPLAVLTHSRTIPNPFGFPPKFPIAALDRAFQESQDMLADLVPDGRLVIAARSGHYIHLDQPRLVTREVRQVVREARRLRRR